MKIIEIKGNTYCIDTGRSFIPFYKINNKEIILLDSGWIKEREGIEHILENNGYTVAGIINSHAHLDHIGNNAYFKEKYNCITAMPAYEAAICKSAVNLKVYYSNMTMSEITTHLGHMVCETDLMILDDQEKIYMNGVPFEILHTPGHSPAHICISTPDDVAYIGDILIGNGLLTSAKLPYSFMLKEDLKSKEKLYDLKGSKYVVAHKNIYNHITTLVTDNIDFYKNKANSVYTTINGTMTMDDILSAVVKSFDIKVNDKYKYTVIESLVRSYVEYLTETGMLGVNLNNGTLKYSKTA